MWRKILNKKCGAIEKCGARWGKNYYIKVWCRQNLLSKLWLVLFEKFEK